MAKIGPWSTSALLAAHVLLFGFESGAVLATVAGVLIEVPVMLQVWVVNKSRTWYKSGSCAKTAAAK